MSGGNAYKRKSHRRIEVITSVAAVVVLYVILESFGVTCPIKYITGISCAGCGMSRAWIALMHLIYMKHSCIIHFFPATGCCYSYASEI